jgi:nucleoside-diphosphate-sugar epimerase
MTITTEAELEEALSRPTAADIAAMAALDGDLTVLGVSGKMGPSLARLAKRACDEAGVRKKVLGVARFSTPGVRERLLADRIETLPCDLENPEAVAALPNCPNIVFMVGQKFGTSHDAERTWHTNTIPPALVADRFCDSRIVAFSTGNVYPLTPIGGGGPTELDETGPVGAYAESALARERVFEASSEQHGTPVALLRLNYANELRYGVLRDVADCLIARQPIDLAMGYVNVIWQRDANSIALQSFAHCASPPFVLNLTGTETVSIRSLAQRFGKLLGVEPILEGTESNTALLSNASRCAELFGPPEVSLDQMIAWIADWVRRGGVSLGKPTHYEVRTGEF